MTTVSIIYFLDFVNKCNLKDEVIMNKQNKLNVKQQKALETKEKLFECTTVLFQKKIYHKVTVDEIVKMAGVSKGTFYTYFKSKNQVIAEQLKILDDYYETFYQKLSKYEKMNEKILAFTKYMFNFTATKIGFHTIYMLFSTQLPERYGQKQKIYYREEERPFYKYIQKMVKQGQIAGEFRNDIAAEKITKMFLCCIVGIFYEWCSHDGNFDIVEEGMFLISLFMKSIKK